ncbi:hypothetical protein ZIOFF_046226 [Zingiber officinale]|uniref:3-dehydroquinate synthase C-terminal domain-containing protein n=1 Tax=Zingiber officinale TaxID=94328 RepID=A0A8J5G572_ZINOF|nr:hypothetical protein ZIOFF_046226 [Zingiber officinale]
MGSNYRWAISPFKSRPADMHDRYQTVLRSARQTEPGACRGETTTLLRVRTRSSSLPHCDASKTEAAGGWSGGIISCGQDCSKPSFYQPQCVLIDTDALNTLPDRELASDIGEIVKCGLVRDAKLFEWQEQNLQSLLRSIHLAYAIKPSCENKTKVGSLDEKGRGIRATLNFEHTFGRMSIEFARFILVLLSAIETVDDGQWLHGEAVATGLCYQSGIRAGLSEGADANSQRRDQLALGQIHQGVDYSIFGLIANAKTAKEAWDTLKLSYKGVDRAQKSKLQSLRRLYDRCEMSSTEIVEHYFSRLTDLVNKMRLYGDKIGDDAVVEKILRTIPLKYDHVVASIQESHDIELLTIAELKDCRYKKFNNHGNQANIAGNYGEDSNESETLLLAKKEKSIIVPDIPDDFLDEQPTQDNVQVSVQSEAPTRRSQRECRLPARLQDYVLSNDNDLSDEEIHPLGGCVFTRDYDRKALDDTLCAFCNNR